MTHLTHPFVWQVIPIIHIPGFGDKAAEKVCRSAQCSDEQIEAPYRSESSFGFVSQMRCLQYGKAHCMCFRAC